jgi:hypothetical protein
VPVSTTLKQRFEVRLSVFNASGVPGVGQQVFDEFRSREFQMVTLTDPYPGEYMEVAVIRYGPRAVGAAWLVAAYFREPAKDFDIHRADDTVDVILGKAFQQLNTTTEVNQAIAAAGRPTAPPGTCAVD